VEKHPVCAVGGEEQHALELDVTLERERALPVVASDATLFVLSRPAGDQPFSGLSIVCSFTGDSSVASATQQEGIPILSISVQRHSARSREAFHSARECCIPVRGVEQALGVEPSAICVIEVCIIALRHFSAHHQWEVFDQGRTPK